MSNIPMRFRDWWDEYDRDFDSNMSTWRWPRTSRLVDQHFGTTFRRNDLINQLANANISAPAPYFRPYSLARQDSGSTVNMAKDKFEVLLDVQQFRPDEICVKTSDKFIIVEGKHEEKQDEHGYVSRWEVVAVMTCSVIHFHHENWNFSTDTSWENTSCQPIISKKTSRQVYQVMEFWLLQRPLLHLPSKAATSFVKCQFNQLDQRKRAFSRHKRMQQLATTQMNSQKLNNWTKFHVIILWLNKIIIFLFFLNKCAKDVFLGDFPTACEKILTRFSSSGWKMEAGKFLRESIFFTCHIVSFPPLFILSYLKFKTELFKVQHEGEILKFNFWLIFKAQFVV